MRVAAVIPTYNRAHLIRRSIKSVLSQTRPVDEVIVVDDGSIDSTRDVVSEFGERVHYIYQENRGVTAARNRGVAASTSDWIAFLDSDDEWASNKIERQCEELRKTPDAVLCYCSIMVISNDKRKVAHCPPVDRLWPGIRLKNMFAPSSVMLSKEAFNEVGGFDPRLRGPDCEDWDLFIRMAARFRLICLDEPLLNYYESPESASMNERVLLPATLSIVDRSLLINLHGIQRLIWRQRIRSVLYHRAAVSARAAGRPAAKLLANSILNWPSPFFHFRRFKTVAAALLGH